MSKTAPIKSILMLLSLIVAAGGQESNKETRREQSVKLTIYTDKNICVGDNFAIVSRLENISKRDMVINFKNITQLLSETAFGTYPDAIISGSRGLIEKLYAIDNPPNFRIKLKSGEFYEYKNVIDVKKDDFFKSKGRYGAAISFIQPGPEPKKMDDETVFGDFSSNFLEIEIKDCS